MLDQLTVLAIEIMHISPKMVSVEVSTNVSIRLVTDSGETVDSEIGQRTVEVWQTVYALQTVNGAENY
jgi:hypothetical protein